MMFGSATAQELQLQSWMCMNRTYAVQPTTANQGSLAAKGYGKAKAMEHHGLGRQLAQKPGPPTVAIAQRSDISHGVLNMESAKPIRTAGIKNTANHCAS